MLTKFKLWVLLEQSIATMTPQLRLQKHNLADLQCIREIGEDKLRRVGDAVGKLPIAPVQPKQLFSEIVQALDGDDTAGDILIRQLLSLHGMSRQLGLTPEEVFAGLDSALSESEWTTEEIASWKTVSPFFRQLFELPIVMLSAKALDLSYQHSHLLQQSQIITDIRPLFNKDASEIQGTIISHKLLLRYDDIEGEHVLSLAVDEKDIQSLILQCERARKKAQTSKRQLGEKADLKTLVPGEE